MCFGSEPKPKTTYYYHEEITPSRRYTAVAITITTRALLEQATPVSLDGPTVTARGPVALLSMSAIDHLKRQC
ncbi:hypothetical protein ACHAP5_006084 [Fusarium lateritium]